MCSVPIRDSGGKEHGTHGALCVVGHFQHQVHIEILCVIRRRGGREPDLCMDMRGRMIGDSSHKTAGNPGRYILHLAYENLHELH